MNQIHEIRYSSPKMNSLKIRKNELKILTANLLDSVNFTHNLRHILTLLKLMGCILVSEDQDKNNHQTVFYFELCSWNTIKSIVTKLIFGLLCYLNTSNS